MRDGASIALEADYWQGLLADLQALSEGIGTAADQLLEAVGPVTIAGVGVPPHLRDDLDKASRAIAETMQTLGRMHDPIFASLRLAEGRAAALRAELDGLERGGA